MTKQKLLEHLQDIEWDNFEVKTARTDVPKDVWETVSAFSNTSGGWIVFGVLQLSPQAKRYKIDGKNVLAFYIPSSDIKPVYFNGVQNTFIRTGSGDQQASEFEINALYRDQAFGSMSEKAVEGTSVDSLNKASYKRFREYLKGFNPNLHYNTMEDDEFNQLPSRVTRSGSKNRKIFGNTILCCFNACGFTPTTRLQSAKWESDTKTQKK
ncbi:hypothetical protein FACS189413_03350 [Bacteroidia bacterium]|nr:hypothetical protein FACS189413_03350 [Bacteroidia bacterium]